MGKLISFDFAIKYLLRDKGDYDIIEGFISALLVEQGYKPVKILALLDTESNKEEYSQKKSLADLIVEDADHTKYIIEIERQLNKDFIHKSCFNTSRLIVDQLGTNMDYTNIKKVFHVSLLYFSIGEGTIYHGKTIFHETETKEKLTFHIEDKSSSKVYDAVDMLPEYIFISIPQFDDRLGKEIHEWLYVMKHGEVKPEFKSPTMAKVSERLNMLNMTKSMRDAYFNYTKEVATVKGALETAEEKGIEKGRESRNLEIAKNMLSEGFDIGAIERITGLPKQTIETLLKK